MARHRDRIRGGVVHSFTGSWEEAQRLLDLDLFIGMRWRSAARLCAPLCGPDQQRAAQASTAAR